jgi:polyisoprenyl-phosphate glycosyltransferase
MSAPRSSLAIVVPVFNDWESFTLLLADLERELAGAGFATAVLAVDDGSTDETPAFFPLGGVITKVHVARLGMNVGHQRAIAVGLVYIATAGSHDFVAVMDGDGEDRADELLRLLRAAQSSDQEAFVAQRKKRSEGVTFRLFWRSYKKLFELLTGQRIGFGNFSVLPRGTVEKLVHNPNIWNNFPATLIQSRFRIAYVPTARGTRYRGQSKMNFVGLITHGLGAISVFSEAVFIRILITSCLLLGASVTAAIVVIAIRLFSSIAIPGWTTNVLGFAVLLSFQAVMLPILVGFLLLNNRASMQSLPKDSAANLIASVLVFDAPR